jgi:UDP-N-acetylmuramyl pentapeptide phosphotransferase/UDP-N-acetylglucosamine-1-phosphate transferase
VQVAFSFDELFRLDAFAAGLTSLFVSALLVMTAKWHGIYSMDSIHGVQKFHEHPTPRIGGIAIALAVLSGLAASSPEPIAAAKRAILMGIILAGLPAFVFGLLEDLTKKVSVRARLIATVISGVLGWGITGVSIQSVGVPAIDWLLGFTIISVLLTGFAVGGLANAVNMIDGFHGLAAGCVLIMLTAFGVIARQVGDIPLAFSCLVIAGAVGGFLLINWPFGKLFLGDGGAYFVGFAVGWVAVLLPHRNASVSPWVSLLVCAYPVIEVLFSYVRKSRRLGHHPSQPDRVHMHMLIHRRIVKIKLKQLPDTLQNGFSSPLCWLIASIPAFHAVRFYSNAHILGCVFVLCVLGYAILYKRLVRFKW